MFGTVAETARKRTLATGSCEHSQQVSAEVQSIKVLQASRECQISSKSSSGPAGMHQALAFCHACLNLHDSTTPDACGLTWSMPGALLTILILDTVPASNAAPRLSLSK